MFAAAGIGLLVLPVWALICLVAGGVRHGRLSTPLFVAALVPPLCVLAFAVWDWFFSGLANAEAPYLFYPSLAVAVILSAALVGTRRGWRGSGVLTLIGLGIPGIVSVPLLFFVLILALNGGME